MHIVRILPFLIILFGVSSIAGFYFTAETESSTQKINGICFVAPNHRVKLEHIKPISEVNAGWVAITPYAFSRKGKPEVWFDNERQWWGERTEGTKETISAAKKQGLKIMLKPHIWVMGQGWAGEYDLELEAEWKVWEKDYSKYILTYAHMADSLDVEMLCIGTEYRIAVQKRPAYWKQLIKEVRLIYKGQVTYASNWDNYMNVSFWPDLDLIGVDAYFPICKEKTPEVSLLINNWQETKSTLQDFSKKYDKQIVFTEFGYRSMDYTTAGHWEMDHQEGVLNMTGQKNALEAIFKTYWDEPWFAGGFLWKWHSRHTEIGGQNCSKYTPQNKPAQELVKLWYGEYHN